MSFIAIPLRGIGDGKPLPFQMLRALSDNQSEHLCVRSSLPATKNTSFKGVAFVSLKEQIDTSGATGKLIVSVLGAISAYEREINAERREYAYRKSYEEGRVGRPKAQASDTFYDAVKEWRKGSITATEAIAKAQMPRATFYRLVKAEGL